jgi:hypothetical protein
VSWQERHVDVWPVFELRRHRIGPAPGRDEDKGYTSLCQNFSNGKYRLICKVDVEERGIDIHSAGSIQPECSLLVWKSEWIIHSGLAQVRPVRSPSQTYHWLALRPLPTVMSAILASADAAGAERMRLVKMWRTDRSPFAASIGIYRATRFCWRGRDFEAGFRTHFRFQDGKAVPVARRKLGRVDRCDACG